MTWPSGFKLNVFYACYERRLNLAGESEKVLPFIHKKKCVYTQRGSTRRWERDILQVHVATEQGEMASNCQRAGLD